MNVSIHWVQKLWVRYKRTTKSDIIYPIPLGRPKNNTLGRREHSAIISACTVRHKGAASMEHDIEDSMGIDIRYNIIHKLLRDKDLATKQLKKSRRRH